MAGTVKVKVNTNQLNRALKEVQERVERVTVSTIEGLMDEQIEEVYRAYQKAVYDGSTEDIEVYAEQLGPRTWQLVAEGEGVLYIEFGTGAVRNPSYVNPTTKQPYWFFSAKGRNIKLNSSGSPARKIYYRTTRDLFKEKFVIKTSLGIKAINRSKAQEAHRITTRDGKEYFNEGGRLFFNPRTHQEEWRGSNEYELKKLKIPAGSEKADRYPVDKGERKGVYITRGNPPNYIMRDAAQRFTEELLRQFRVRFK